jgi:hypothetical protein
MLGQSVRVPENLAIYIVRAIVKQRPGTKNGYKLLKEFTSFIKLL